jgi:RNA polymerase sigma-70 factor (ECF subfamily)
LSAPAPSGPGAPGDDRNDPDRILVDRLQAYLEDLKQHGKGGPPDSAEWDHFVRLYRVRFVRLVRSRDWPEADRDDAVQELLVTVMREFAEFHFDPRRGCLENWIMATARHRAADLERARRQRSMECLSLEYESSLPSREPGPEAAFDRKCLQEQVWNALTEVGAQFASEDFDAFLLHWFGGLTVREISHRVGRPETQLWSSHHRIIEKLRAVLARRLEIDSCGE